MRRIAAAAAVLLTGCAGGQPFESAFSTGSTSTSTTAVTAPTITLPEMGSATTTTRRPSTTTTLQRASRSARERTPAVPVGSNRAIGQQMAAERGWTDEQWNCLERLWTKESGWNHLAANRSSGAYGIPQALPGTKMATAGADWRINPATQIRWGLGYVGGRYGTPCGAWSHFLSRGWY